MVEEVESPSLDRKVMSRILGKIDLSDETKERIAVADAYVDEALDAVDEEEPSLLEWLQNDEDLDTMVWANKSVMYWLIRRDFARNKALETTVDSISTLFTRLLAATAWRARHLPASENQAAFDRLISQARDGAS